MKWFYIFFQIVIFLILLLFWFSAKYLEINFSNINNLEQALLYITIVIIEFLIIMFFVIIFYQKPIEKLEYTIKKFLVGNYTNSKKELPRTLNKSLNYCIVFFWKTLDTLKNIKDEFVYGREIKWEVSLAKEIQEKMLTKKMIEVPSFEIIVKSKPAWEIGWDSFDIIKQKDNYYIYVWDATGHWVWAWVIMTMVNALVSWFSKIYESWDNVLIKTNEILKPRVKANLLMSLLLVRWDETEKRLFMTWAGHEYLMIYKQKDKKTYKIKSKWVALWMAKDISKVIKEVELKVEPGDIIVLYSDWITEAINKPKRDGNEILFWEDRLVRSIQEAPNIQWKNYKSARSVFNNITINLSKFMWYKYTQLDDITLWVIQYKTKDYDKKDDFPENINDELITEWKW